MKNILIIDDEPEVLQTISTFFLESGLPYNITNAPDGNIALKIIEQKQLDLIITDWEMPNMNGIELIKRLKKNNSTTNIPVIMCTGIMTSSENLYTALNAGAVDFIRKPIDKIELIARTKANLHLAASYMKIIKLNSIKDQFFSIIAHDLKSSLNTMLGFSELLNYKFEKYDIEKRKHFFGMIHAGIQNTYKLLENLLLWSRSQHGSIKFSPEKLNLYLLSYEIIELFMQSFNNKDINIKNKIHERIFVNADKDMLSTTIKNLISNAIKFTPKGGNIEIGYVETRRAVETRHGVSLHEIYVKDNGIGISKKNQKKIFDIGKNISTKGTENESGTGLGLIICKEFVEKHKGRIWVESEIGKGSKFAFTIPT